LSETPKAEENRFHVSRRVRLNQSTAERDNLIDSLIIELNCLVSHFSPLPPFSAATIGPFTRGLLRVPFA
jgi:hypothetical protein